MKFQCRRSLVSKLNVACFRWSGVNASRKLFAAVVIEPADRCCATTPPQRAASKPAARRSRGEVKRLIRTSHADESGWMVARPNRASNGPAQVACHLLTLMIVCLHSDEVGHMRRLNLLLFAFALSVVACDDNPARPTDQAVLRDVTWKLETIERAGSPTITVPNPELYTLILDNDGNVAVRADCN